MISKENAKTKVKSIVDEFLTYSKEEINKKSEFQIQAEFIDPLFEALGWDMRKDAEREERVLKGRADYILKIGNQNKLVIEAKKTSVRLEEKEGRQAVSYAHHKNIKFAVLTNFKQIRIYHALSNIKNIDKNLLKDDKGYLRFDCQDLIEQFDRLWLLSRESFEKEEIDKLLKNVDKKLIKPIDEAILTDLLYYREWLSKDLKSKRNYLEDNQIDEIVQILIDRLIFMRSVEDRGLEGKDFLLTIIDSVQKRFTDKNLWALLKDQFKRFDETYNSKLFAEGLLEKEGAFADDVLIKTIKGLYYGTQDYQERYLFDEIPVDLLGSIYEQYLGVVLRGTEKRVKLDLVSGKRKKMGIYYTPFYIVDYIIKNTIGEYCKEKSLDKILDIKIVDPACGSGSFLIDAFQELCNIVEERLKKGEKPKKWDSFNSYSKRLSIGQKATILINCIYGVDLDEKAVELTQLNLLLKILEEETRETRKKLLPNMKDNIKNGNSLISDSSFDKAFNWNAQFPEVFKDGGFDIVVGNPPYIRIQTLDKKEVSYFNQIYKTPEKNYDIYVLFIEKGYDLLKEKGMLGYILPNKFFNADYGKGIRNFLIEKKAIRKILDFKDYQVFENATTYTCLLFLSKKENRDVVYCTPQDNKKLETGILDEESLSCSNQEQPKSDLTWSLSDKTTSEIFNKLNKIEIKLGDVCSKLFVGLQTSADPIYIVKIIKEEKSFYEILCRKTNKIYKIEKEIVKPILMGKDILRWSINWRNLGLIFPYKIECGKAYLIEEKSFKDKYPNAWKYFLDNKKILDLRESGRWKNRHNWHAFVYEKNLTSFSQPKILTQVLSNSNKFTLDNDGEYYFVGGGNAGGYGIILIDEYKDKYEVILGLLNSSVLEFYLKNISTVFRGGYYSYAKRFIERFPIKLPSEVQAKRVKELVERIIRFYKEGKSEQDIRNVDYEIDQEVYKLYSLTKEEIKIIEENLK